MSFAGRGCGIRFEMYVVGDWFEAHSIAVQNVQSSGVLKTMEIGSLKLSFLFPKLFVVRYGADVLNRRAGCRSATWMA